MGRLERIEAAVQKAREALTSFPAARTGREAPGTAPDVARAVRIEARALVFEEIAASSRLAGADFRPDEVAALVEHNAVSPNRTYAAHTVAHRYADAALLVAASEPARAGRPFVRLAEVRDLHARAVGFDPAARPGAWRTTTVRPLLDGAVPSAFWLVPFEMAAFGDRLNAGPQPGGSVFRWLAEVHERLHRARPFSTGNGRVARLTTNLALRRLGLPPFFVAPSRAARYRAALAGGDAGDLEPLARFIATSVQRSLQRLTAAASSDELRPLLDLIAPEERARFYKASQRGRLRTVRRRGSLCSTQLWVDEYRARPPGAR